MSFIVMKLPYPPELYLSTNPAVSKANLDLMVGDQVIRIQTIRRR